MQALNLCQGAYIHCKEFGEQSAGRAKNNKGEQITNRMTFPNRHANLRSDTSINKITKERRAQLGHIDLAKHQNKNGFTISTCLHAPSVSRGCEKTNWFVD